MCKLKLFWVAIISLCFSCQSSVGTGAVIVYGDVIGSYQGRCADYTTSISDLINREDASLSVSAMNTTEANIKTSCVRFEDQTLTLKTSSASEITFEKVISITSVISLRYIAASDSLVLIQTGIGDNNIMFTGIRN